MYLTEQEQDVVVTEEMIEEGVFALSGFDEGDSRAEIVTAVFLAMLHASKRQP